jgi:hypothetical protein
MAFEAQMIDEYFRSAMFRKEFKIEGDKIQCSRTM